jgi:hypothetical protein
MVNKKFAEKIGASVEEAAENDSVPPAGGTSVTPEPEGVRGTSGMSGNQGTDEPAAWCVMESDVLNGDRFLLVRDDLYSSDQLADRITEQARSQADAIYTMTEMNHITAAELTDEDKRKLHALKKAFGGDVIGDDPAGEAFPCVDISDWIESNGG